MPLGQAKKITGPSRITGFTKTAETVPRDSTDYIKLVARKIEESERVDYSFQIAGPRDGIKGIEKGTSFEIYTGSRSTKLILGRVVCLDISYNGSGIPEYNSKLTPGRDFEKIMGNKTSLRRLNYRKISGLDKKFIENPQS